MPATPPLRLLSGLAALALTGGTLLVPPTAWAQTADPSAEQVASAAGWLAGELSDAGTVTGSFPDGEGGTIDFTDWGRTLDSALALLAAGGEDDVLGRTLASVEGPDAVAEYTQGAPFDAEDAAYAGATAKLATVVELSGGDATDVGGVDLLAQLRGLAQPSGRYEDSSTFGDYANLFGHSFALLAFDTAGQTQPADALAGLLTAQCADGGFPVTYEPTGTGGCSGEVDATGLVLQALAAVGEGESAAAQDAAAWLLDQQQADGRFPGEAPVNSTGYALLGLNAVGEPGGAAATWLSAQQNADGGLGKGDGSASDLFATAQALPGWAGETFVSAARPVARAGAVPTDPTPTPTPTPTDPAPTEPTPTDPAPTEPATPTEPAAPAPTATEEPAPSTGAPVPGSGTDGGVEGEGRTTGSGTSGGGLPRTGADAGSLVSAGLALLAAGAGLLVAGATRRRSRSQASR